MLFWVSAAHLMLNSCFRRTFVHIFLYSNQNTPIQTSVPPPGIYLPSNYDDYYASGGTTSISSSSSASRLSGGDIFKFNITNRSHENILSSLINNSSSSSGSNVSPSQVVYGVGSGGHVAQQYQQQTPNTPGTPGSYFKCIFYISFFCDRFGLLFCLLL